MPTNETTDTQTGREQRYLHNCCGTDPLEKREDHTAKLIRLFNPETLPVNYSDCFGCRERTNNNDLEKRDGDWYCEKCRADIDGFDATFGETVQSFGGEQ